jgi:hypothetical protein
LIFNWSPFYENIAILGQQGEGKTTLCRGLLNLIPNIPRWIWSPQRAMDNYGGYGTPVNTIEELHHGQYIFTGKYTKENFLKFCNKAFFDMKNIVLVFDDIHEFVKKQFIPPELENLILSGRNQGISSIFLSPMPSVVHNSILASCQHCFGFKFNLQTHIEWMKNNFFGEEAWLLLPKDKRDHRFYQSENDYDILPRGSYIYRKNSDTQNQLIITGENVKSQDSNIQDEENGTDE